jgi:hypothetical protein
VNAVGGGRLPDGYGNGDIVTLEQCGSGSASGRHRIVGSTIGLDTISHGVLTAVRLPDRLVIQSERHPYPASANAISLS